MSFISPFTNNEWPKPLYKKGQIVLIYMNYNSNTRSRGIQLSCACSSSNAGDMFNNKCINTGTHYKKPRIVAIENENSFINYITLPPWYFGCLLYPSFPCILQPTHFDIVEDEILSIFELERYINLFFGIKFELPGDGINKDIPANHGPIYRKLEFKVKNPEEELIP